MLLGTGGVYALTRNTTKALSVLMVDFSCTKAVNADFRAFGDTGDKQTPYHSQGWEVSGSAC